MADACIQDPTDIRIDFNFNNTGGDFRLIDKDAPSEVIV